MHDFDNYFLFIVIAVAVIVIVVVLIFSFSFQSMRQTLSSNILKTKMKKIKAKLI